jgi:cell division cycle protein 37
MRERVREISAEKEKGGQAVEQIQLHAVDPNTTINITIPASGSDDPTVRKAREVFESFPPGLRRALESGSLDEVNKVLGKMSVEEAEEVVSQLGEVSRLRRHAVVLANHLL